MATRVRSLTATARSRARLILTGRALARVPGPIFSGTLPAADSFRVIGQGQEYERPIAFLPRPADPLRAGLVDGHARGTRRGPHRFPVLSAWVPAARLVPGGEGAARSLHAHQVLGRDARIRGRAHGAGADDRRAALWPAAAPPRW